MPRRNDNRHLVHRCTKTINQTLCSFIYLVTLFDQLPTSYRLQYKIYTTVNVAD